MMRQSKRSRQGYPFLCAPLACTSSAWSLTDPWWKIFHGSLADLHMEARHGQQEKRAQHKGGLAGPSQTQSVASKVAVVPNA